MMGTSERKGPADPVGSSLPEGGTGGAAGGARADGSGGTGTTAAACSPGVQAGARPRLWRLNSVQYANTISTLLGGRSKDRNRDLVPAKVVAPFGAVSDSDRFTTFSDSYAIRDNELRDAMATAEDVASRLVGDLMTKSCLAQDGGFDACVKTLVKERGELLFRRPLTDVEVNKYAQLAIDVVGMAGKRPAAELTFRSMLMAPQFLYRSEVGAAMGTGGMVRRLTPFEIASALSYSLTDGPPDAPLWEAARTGALSDPAQISAQVARLAGGLAETASVQQMLKQYFRYGRAATLSKKADYNADTIMRQADLFVQEVLSKSGRKDFLKALLTSNVVFSNKSTAAAYGVMATGDKDLRFELDGDRAGILGQPAWMWAVSQPERTDPIRRGAFVREHLLCQPALQVNIAEVAPLSKDDKLTMREKLDQHRSSPNCRACHELLDPMGLAMEAFDHLGKVRTTEAGKPVDTTGKLVGSADQDGPVRGLRELAGKLATSSTVRSCFNAEMMQFWLGRTGSDGDTCAVAAMDRAYDASGGDLVAVLQALFSSESFLVKRL